jgi:ABC-2 type transport system ATP-binding protein
VFAQLVDDETGLVLGNQITPIPLVLDGATHELTIPLEVVAFSARPGSSLTLQLVATTTAYGLPRLGGTVTFAAVEVALPVATGTTPR